jgi:hypothetical protein
MVIDFVALKETPASVEVFDRVDRGMGQRMRGLWAIVGKCLIIAGDKSANMAFGIDLVTIP